VASEITVRNCFGLAPKEKILLQNRQVQKEEKE